MNNNHHYLNLNGLVKSMKKTEKILIVLFILGQIMRLTYLSGGTFISIFSGTLLATFYLILSVPLMSGLNFKHLFSKNHQIKKYQIRLTFFLGISFCICTMGILFKLQIFTEANLFLFVGMLFLTGSSTLFVIKCRKARIYQDAIVRIISFAAVSGLLLIIPFKSMVDLYFNKYPDYANALKEQLDNPHDDEIRWKVLEEREKINHER